MHMSVYLNQGTCYSGNSASQTLHAYSCLSYGMQLHGYLAGQSIYTSGSWSIWNTNSSEYPVICRYVCMEYNLHIIYIYIYNIYIYIYML